MGALDQVVAPIADLHGALGQRESTAQPLVRWGASAALHFNWAILPTMPACLFCGADVTAGKLTTLWLETATSVKEGLRQVAGTPRN